MAAIIADAEEGLRQLREFAERAESRDTDDEALLLAEHGEFRIYEYDDGSYLAEVPAGVEIDQDHYADEGLTSIALVLGPPADDLDGTVIAERGAFRILEYTEGTCIIEVPDGARITQDHDTEDGFTTFVIDASHLD